MIALTMMIAAQTVEMSKLRFIVDFVANPWSPQLGAFESAGKICSGIYK